MYDLYLKVNKAPGKGLLNNVTVGDGQSRTIDLDAPVERMEWVKVPEINITDTSDKISLQNSGPVQASLEQAILLSPSEWAEKVQQFHQEWDGYVGKLIFLYDGTALLHDADGWTTLLGQEGWGVAPIVDVPLDCSIVSPHLRQLHTQHVRYR